MRSRQSSPPRRTSAHYWRLAALALAALGSRTAGASGAPAWMQSLSAAPLPAHDERADAVMLYSETVLSVQANGKLRRVERAAFKILRPDGAERGLVRVDYGPRSRVTEIRAWSMPAEGKPYEVGDRDAIDSALPGLENGALVSDVRSRLLKIPAALPGNIVGYEVEREDQPLMLADEWAFQDTVATREARFTLQLPPGWTYHASWFNHAEVPPVGSAGSWQWTLSDLNAIKVEDDMPPWHGVAGHLWLTFAPPAGGGGSDGLSSWRQMGSWYQELTRGRRDASPEIRQKVTELTAASHTPLEKLRALAAFVQSDIRYVAIELGIGGLQPHPAAEVFTHRYGDCKDKVTLLSAMLKEAGFDSTYLIVNTRRGTIGADTPPTLDFNHVILAVPLAAEIADDSLLALTTHARLGRMLFFDPTDPFTPFGSLAGPLQGSYGLLVAPEGGELVQLPQLPPEHNSLKRTAHMMLDAAGALHGEVHESFTGDAAAAQRGALAARADNERAKAVESHLAEAFATFALAKATVGNAHATDKPLEWNYTLDAEHYAKSSGDLLMVRPRILGSKSSGMLETREPRTYPIEFEAARHDSDLFEITLPEGYVLDELPPPVDLDIGFAAYHSKTVLAGATLRYSRSYEVRSLAVPVDKADALKHLWRVIAGDERALAVVRRASP